MVFITASPVLTNEVRRFYGHIKAKLLSFLKKRDDQIKMRKQQFENITEQEAQQIIDDVIQENAKENIVVQSIEE